jgi:hypothetical protein
LLPRQTGDPTIPDPHFRMDVKLRLGCRVCPEGALCHHRRRDGTLCNEPLDPHGWHARKCGCGQSRDHRHNSLRNWHAPYHKEVTGHFAVTEKRVPAWDRVDPRTGVLEEARLDVATRDAVNGRPIYVDWSVTCEHSEYQPRRHARSNKDGLAAANMVDDKRDRYPPRGGELVPMVFETNGRPSDEAVAFVRSYGHGLSQADRAEVVGTAWRQISRTLQIGNAEMVLSANG